MDTCSCRLGPNTPKSRRLRGLAALSLAFLVGAIRLGQLDVQISGTVDIYDSNHSLSAISNGVTSSDKIDACAVSKAIESHPLRVSTYPPLPPVTFPGGEIPFPHTSAALCSRHMNKQPAKRDESDGRSPQLAVIFAFKAARTGSTFFTTVIKKTVRKTGRPAHMFWEPFCTRRCRGATATYMENALVAVMTQKCQWGDRCHPDQHCEYTTASSKEGRPIYISAANPRFMTPNQMDWARVFQRVPEEPHIFSLRRTNLVLMGYSKLHMKGCDISTEQPKRKKKEYSMDMLLRCAEHYALGDQEISSSAAHHAAASAVGTKQRPFLVVYEDVLSNEALVQKGVLSFLGLDVANYTKVFTDNASTKKIHNKPFCDNQDVNCTELYDGLHSSRQFPCLLKQLTRESEGLTWSVPMLSDGTISIKGDCHPLEPLTGSHFVRSFEELYQLPAR